MKQRRFEIFELARKINGSCLECSKDMWSEGPIHDDILICHACYDNDVLKKHGYSVSQPAQECGTICRYEQV